MDITTSIAPSVADPTEGELLSQLSGTNATIQPEEKDGSDMERPDEIEDDNDQSQAVLNPIDQELLTTMLEKGNWEGIRMHCDAGNVSILTNKLLAVVMDKADKYNVLLANLRHIVLALKPIMERRNELAEYIDLQGGMFVNMGKVMTEFGPLLTSLMFGGAVHKINPFKKDKDKPKPQIDTPFIRIVSSGDKAQWEKVNMDALLQAVSDSGVSTEDFTEFYKQIGADTYFAKKEGEVGDE